MKNIIALVVSLGLISLAINYLVKSTKNNKGCVGCPYSGTCHSCKKDNKRIERG